MSDQLRWKGDWLEHHRHDSPSPNCHLCKRIPTYAESLRRAQLALNQLLNLAVDACEPLGRQEAAVEQEELLDEPGPDIVEYWGAARQI